MEERGSKIVITSAADQITPPRSLSYLLVLVLPHDMQDGLIGDLNQYYRKNIVIYGPLRANLAYFRQAMTSILPVVVASVKRIGRWIAAAFGIHTLDQLIHRFVK